MPRDERNRDRTKGGEDAWSKMSVGDWLTRTGQAKNYRGDTRVGTAAGRAVFDPYDAVANEPGAGAGAIAGRQMVAPGAGVGAMTGRTLAGIDAQRAVDDANALAGWYEAMAYPNPADPYLAWGDDSANLGYGPGPGGGTRMGYEQAIPLSPRIAQWGPGQYSGADPLLESPYGRQMIRGVTPSPDIVNAQRVLGLNRLLGY